jgi:hypothetical protein
MEGLSGDYGFFSVKSLLQCDMCGMAFSRATHGHAWARAHCQPFSSSVLSIGCLFTRAVTFFEK